MVLRHHRTVRESLGPFKGIGTGTAATVSTRHSMVQVAPSAVPRRQASERAPLESRSSGRSHGACTGWWGNAEPMPQGETQAPKRPGIPGDEDRPTDRPASSLSSDSSNLSNKVRWG